MTQPPEITVVTETFNLEEGQGIEATRQALIYLVDQARRRGNVEILLADPMPANLLVDSLLKQFPEIRHLSAPGAGYDGLKNLAAHEARGRYVVYLDSDCQPTDSHWLDRLLEPLRSGQAQAVAGTTYYYGTSIWARVQSMLDFGFLIGNDETIAGCYASNNCAFVRDYRAELEAPDGPMRSTCYAHAQNMIRAGRPMLRVHDAVCLHKLPDFWRERFRRGFDLVAACWVDPYLEETRWLRYRVLAAPFFVGKALRTDWRQLDRDRRLWNWNGWQVAAARFYALCSRAVDLAGAVRALALGPDKRRSAYGALAGGASPLLAKAQDSA